MPLKTRDGVAEAPIEPGLRMLCEPCVFGPRWKRWRLIVPAKPLPIEMPGDLDRVAGLERLDGDGLADGQLGAAAELDEAAMRLDAVLAQVPELALRQLPLGDGVERELHGVVAVRRHGLHLDHGAWTGLDDRHGRDDAGLLVEDLGHAQLSPHDPLHSVS